MNFLEERIVKDGIVKSGNVLKLNGSAKLFATDPPTECDTP